MSELIEDTLVTSISETVQNQISDYLQEVQIALSTIVPAEIAQISELILQAGQQGHMIYIIGNGGSAATASHFACDLSKGARKPGFRSFRAIALSDSISQLTAWSNDTDYENCFAGQIEGLGQPGELLIAISGSGNSRNILRAVKVAKNLGLTTIGLAGFRGGKLKDLADYCLIAPTRTMEQAEDVQLVLVHTISMTLRHILAQHSPEYQC